MTVPLTNDDRGDWGDEGSEKDAYGRIYHSCPGLDDQGDSAAPLGSKERQEGDHEARVQCARRDANLLSSLTGGGDHCPVIDLDVPARLLPTSTEGHFHLYVDVGVPWEKFLAMLVAMQEAGIVQKGFVDHARERGQAFVRPPWVKKGKSQASKAATDQVPIDPPPDEGPPF